MDQLETVGTGTSLHEATAAALQQIAQTLDGAIGEALMGTAEVLKGVRSIQPRQLNQPRLTPLERTPCRRMQLLARSPAPSQLF